MRLRANQLVANLKKSGLAPIYLISGDEPLQVMECADTLRQYARQQGFEERIVFDVTGGFDWNSLHDETVAMSLFSSRRLLELRLGDAKPGKDGSPVLTAYASSPPTDNVLIITTGKIDKQSQKSKWFTALDNAGIVIQVWPIDIAELPDWISRRVQEQGRKITMPAAACIAELVEGNLLAAKQEIDKLCLLITKHEITADDIHVAVADSTRFDVFELIEAALGGNPGRVIRILHGLHSEGIEPFSIYGVLMWELRRLCSMAYAVKNGAPLEKIFTEYRIWDNGRKQAIKNCLRRHRIEELHKLFRSAIKIDRKIKSSDRVIVWDVMEAFLLALAGHPLLPHESEAA